MQKYPWAHMSAEHSLCLAMNEVKRVPLRFVGRSSPYGPIGLVLNYDTKEEDIRSLFGNCGPIVDITFPTFEDSGRSKGYCGILFQSPRVVEQALLLHETELHGRWLSVQAGKMMLKQWEARERQ